jgi:mannose-1-phosphate guanylyltransferase
VSGGKSDLSRETLSLHAVILAGGAGERFWPRSRAHHPKPLLRVVGDETLLGATVNRAERFAEADAIWLVCGDEHARAMRRAGGLSQRRTLVEPARRNTAMAVGLAAYRLLAEDPDAVMVVLPADHHIPDDRAFAAAVRHAARAAQREGVLVTLGIRPTRPDTGYGYIRLGAETKGYRGLHRVGRFVEKPGAKTAARYVEGGRHLWNAGIFVWRADAIAREIERCAPELHAALAPVRRWARAPRRSPEGSAKAFQNVMARAYRRAPSQPIDVAVLERSRQVWCLPVRFHWSDVGTWASLAQELGVTKTVSHVIAGEVDMNESRGNLVWGDNRPIVLLGVEGLAVIDTSDALLVAKLERSPEIKSAVERLRKSGRRDLL